MIASAVRPEVISTGCQEKNSHGIFGPIVYDIPKPNRTGIWAKDHPPLTPSLQGSTAKRGISPGGRRQSEWVFSCPQLTAGNDDFKHGNQTNVRVCHYLIGR